MQYFKTSICTCRTRNGKDDEEKNLLDTTRETNHGDLTFLEIGPELQLDLDR